MRGVRLGPNELTADHVGRLVVLVQVACPPARSRQKTAVALHFPVVYFTLLYTRKPLDRR
jgi:hypothetical protein